ncbi:MAG: SLC13 family permease, partial [Myxococcales bacterium]|nr:SLC13 family permease [Myxococcales bacterium]
LASTRIAPDFVLAGALTLLVGGGILSPSEALSGLSNPGLATVAVLFVVAAGLVDTGAITVISNRLFGQVRSVAGAQARMMFPVIAVSAFLNNTPVVAILVPVVQDWCRRQRMSVSRFMIPLSYAAILGGTCSLIGTSTNLVVHGLVLAQTDLGPMGLFSIAQVGLPAAFVGAVYVLVMNRRLLPERRPPLTESPNAREYAIEMLVRDGSPIVGRTIEEAGLRHLPGAFLAEIERGDSVLLAVAPIERLQGGDRLVFVGIVDSVVDLVKSKDLVPAPDQLFKLDTPRPERALVEAVVSRVSPLVGQTIRDGRFRSRYGAVVIAVARDGERVRGKVGDIKLRAGDTLLIEARPSFLEQQRHSRDFLLVSEIPGATPPRHERATVSVLILLAMVVAAATFADMFLAALVASGLMIATRCTTSARARASIDWSVLAVIGASFGLGTALETTGAAAYLARGWLSYAGGGPWLALAVVYLVTMVFTEFITNNAAAVLVFPVAQATANALEVSFWPFVVAIMMAASASFATPIGYQTNLMVYGPGGYRFADYVRFGLPLNLLLAAVTICLIPLFWPF